MPQPPNLELLFEDSDGWSRSFDDQRQYTDPVYRKEREAFWKMIGEMRKEDD